MTFGSEILSWYMINKRDLPWRDTRDPYLIWLSEIILQQTRVEQGLPYYYRFSEKYPTVEKLARARQDEVLKLWQGLGYYSRARNLHEAAKQIVLLFDGQFPDRMEDLLSLKGIGDYTAAAIASFAFDKKEAVVDGNVFRLLSRHFGIKTPIDSSPAKKEFRDLARQLMAEHPPHLFNQAIMEFGARQCKPANPDCGACPLNASCFAYRKKQVNLFPVKEKKQKIRNRFLHYFIIRSGTKFYLCKREGNDIWKNLFEFPLIETTRKTSETKMIASPEWKALFGKSRIQLENISAEVKHLLSHQTIHAKFYEVRTAGAAFKPGKNWIAVTKKSAGKFAVPKLIENQLQAIPEKKISKKSKSHKG